MANDYRDMTHTVARRADYWMDEINRTIDNRRMGGTRRSLFVDSPDAEHYLAVWDVEWRLMERRRLGRGRNPLATLAEAVARFRT